MLAPLKVQPDDSLRIDHGAWSVLAHAYPHTDVPLIQLSIDGTKAPTFHYESGARPAPLRDEGILITGGGNIVHNLPLRKWDKNAAPHDWAVRFDVAVRDVLAGVRP